MRGVRLAALLLFGKEDAIRRHLPCHESAFQVLRGLDVEVNDFFRWPLLRSMEEIESRIRARNREQELMVGLLRVGVPDYSERALREALANALIHRDYQRLGAVHFQWYPDRIELTSPGGFPEGVRLDNLLVTAPRPRNPLLADAFKRAGIVERTARGIDTIFYEQLRNGRPAPSYSRSDAASVTVVIAGGDANLDFVRFLVTEGQLGLKPGLDDLLILNALWQERNLETVDAARLIQKPEVDARATLNRLVEAGLVEERGQKKGRTWHLSAAAIVLSGTRLLTCASADSNRCNRSRWCCSTLRSTPGLRGRKWQSCAASAFQATRLLDRLVKDQRLLRHGERKGTWYERSDKL